MHRRDLLAGIAGMAAGGGLTPALAVGDQDPSVLIVGVSEYDFLGLLPSAVNDAALMSDVFASLGFKTSLLINPSKSEFLYGLSKFSVESRNSPLMLAYIAAHGTTLGGQNQMFFKDSKSIEDRVPETILLQAMNGQPRQKILFLDTCRESPVSHAQQQVSVEQYRAGTHVSYAAQPGAPARDGESGHSPYASALRAALEKPGLDIFEVNRNVRLDVLRQTNGLQVPWERSSLVLPVVLNP